MGFFRFVGRKHAYTGTNVPWQIDDEKGMRLFRYLRGGGVKAFGCTSAEALRAQRRERFVRLCWALGVAWVILWVI